MKLGENLPNKNTPQILKILSYVRYAYHSYGCMFRLNAGNLTGYIVLSTPDIVRLEYANSLTEIFS